MTDRDRAILRRLAAGSTLAEIGRDLGLTRERIRQIAADLGAQPQRERRTLERNARAHLAVTIYRRGETATRAAALARVSPARAIAAIRAAGIDSAEHGRAARLRATLARRAQNLARAVEWYRAGSTIPEVAEALGRSEHTIYRWLILAGEPRRSRGRRPT